MPDNFLETIPQIRRNVVAKTAPAMLAHLEQQYSVWRETMTNNGVEVDDNVIGAVMATCAMLADKRLEEVARVYGVTPEDFIVSILAVSIDPGDLS